MLELAGGYVGIGAVLLIGALMNLRKLTTLVNADSETSGWPPVPAWAVFIALSFMVLALWPVLAVNWLRDKLRARRG